MTGSNCSPPTPISAGCGRWSPISASHVVAGESFAEALARHEGLFPPMYVALIRVGEASGSLDQVLEVLADERSRTEALKRRLGDAIRYPACSCSAPPACVLLFFLTFVLPQFASVLHDFGAKVDPIILGFPESFDLPARTIPTRCWRALAARSPAAGCCCASRACAAASSNAVTRLPAIRR